MRNGKRGKFQPRQVIAGIFMAALLLPRTPYKTLYDLRAGGACAKPTGLGTAAEAGHWAAPPPETTRPPL